MTAPKAPNEQAGLNEGSQAGSHFSGKAIAVEARNRSRYKMVDLLAEMPNGLPRVQGWEEMPSVGLEDC